MSVVQIPRSPVARAGLLIALAGVLSAAWSFLAPRVEADGGTAEFGGRLLEMPVTGTLGGRLYSDVPTGMPTLRMNAKLYAAYCVEFSTPDPDTGTPYREAPWSAAGVTADLGRVTWILHNGFPARSAGSLGGAASATDLTDAMAAAATQSAIWHVTDGWTPSEGTVTLGDGTTRINDPAFLAAYRWLVEQSHSSAFDEPAPTRLSLDPGVVTGAAGGLVGPLTVDTDAEGVALSVEGPTGVRLVGADGQEVTTAVDGDELHLEVPSDADAGGATVHATGSGLLRRGRLFVGDGASAPAQTLILAAAAETTVTGSATLSWVSARAPEPTASVAPNCAISGIDVLLGNPGTAPATFRVVAADGIDQTVEVAPGTTLSVVVPVNRGDAYAVVVSTPQGFLATFDGVLTCDGPPTTVAPPTTIAPPTTVPTTTPTTVATTTPTTAAPPATTLVLDNGQGGIVIVDGVDKPTVELFAPLKALPETGSDGTSVLAAFAVALIAIGGVMAAVADAASGRRRRSA